MALDRHFKPIIKPLRQIVDSLGVRAIRESRVTMTQYLPPNARGRRKRRKRKRRKRKKRKASETFE